MSLLCLLCLGPFSKSVFDLKHGGKTADFGDIKLTTDAEMGQITKALHQGVEVLGFSSCQFQDVGALWAAQWMLLCPKLREVQLGGNGITNQGAVAIAGSLASCVHLQKLLLGVNQIGNEGCQAIAFALPQCVELRTLGLNANVISDESAMSIVLAIPYCKKLVNLNLERNDVSPAVMQMIIDAMKGPRRGPPTQEELNLAERAHQREQAHINELNEADLARYKLDVAKYEFERKWERERQANAKLDRLLDDLPVAEPVAADEEPPSEPEAGGPASQRPLVTRVSF